MSASRLRGVMHFGQYPGGIWMVEPRATPAWAGGMTGVAPVGSADAAPGPAAAGGCTSPSWFRSWANSASTTLFGGGAASAAGGWRERG